MEEKLLHLSENLRELYRRKYFSLAEQVLRSEPYVPLGKEEALRLFERVAESDEKQYHQLAAVILALNDVPAVDSPPWRWIELGYTDITFLLRELVQHTQENIELTRHLLVEAKDHAELRALLEEIQREDEEFLGELQGLGGK